MVSPEKEPQLIKLANLLNAKIIYFPEEKKIFCLELPSKYFSLFAHELTYGSMKGKVTFSLGLKDPYNKDSDLRSYFFSECKVASRETVGIGKDQLLVSGLKRIQKMIEIAEKIDNEKIDNFITKENSRKGLVTHAKECLSSIFGESDHSPYYFDDYGGKIKVDDYNGNIKLEINLRMDEVKDILEYFKTTRSLDSRYQRKGA